jgi:hypothetical protein
MRLLKLDDDGSFSLHTVSGSTTSYAILSHTWGDDEEEVTFEDISNGTGSEKAGYQKLRFCAKQAKADKLVYVSIKGTYLNLRRLSTRCFGFIVMRHDVMSIYGTF